MSFSRTTSHSSRVSFIQINSGICKKASKEILLSHTIVTLNDGQGHSNWCQTIQSSRLYLKTSCERNQSVNIQIQSNVKLFLHEITQVSLFPLYSDLTRKTEYDVQMTKKSQQHTKFHQNPLQTVWNNWCRSFCLLIHLRPWIQIKVIVTKTFIKIWSLAEPITISRLNKTGSQISKCMPTFSFVLFWYS